MNDGPTDVFGNVTQAVADVVNPLWEPVKAGIDSLMNDIMDGIGKFGENVVTKVLPGMAYVTGGLIGNAAHHMQSAAPAVEAEGMGAAAAVTAPGISPQQKMLSGLSGDAMIAVDVIRDFKKEQSTSLSYAEVGMDQLCTFSPVAPKIAPAQSRAAGRDSGMSLSPALPPLPAFQASV